MKNKYKKGFAMGLFLIILTVLTTTVIMLLESARNESKTAYREEQITKARLLGKSAIDSFFSRLNNVEDFPNIQNASVVLDIFEKNSPQSGNKWYKFYNDVLTESSTLSNPRIIECDLSDLDICYQLYVSPNKNLWNNKEICTETDTACLDRKQRVVSVVAKVRYDCKGITDLASVSNKCKFININQRIRKWQFQDFSFFSNYNTVSPGFALQYKWLFPERLNLVNGTDPCAKYDYQRLTNITDVDQREALCPTVNYTYFDVISGDIYSNDDYINVCGDYKSIFIDKIYIFTKGRSSGVKNSCTSSPIQSIRDQYSSSDTVEIKSPLRIPSGKITFEKAKQNSIGVHLCGNVILEINDNILYYDYSTARNAGLQSTGSCANRENDGSVLINNSLITVDGNAFFEGVGNDSDGNNISTVNGRLSIFIKNKTYISESIVYLNDKREVDGDVLGINSGSDIVLQSRKILNCSNVNADAYDLYLQAILISLDGTVYAGGLANNQTEFIDLNNDECPNKLVFFGSMATRYQGAFGIYEGDSGIPLSGFIKNFTFDTRGKRDPNFIPPYITTPTGAVWNRLDINEEYSS
jgi:hypothetical protein